MILYEIYLKLFFFKNIIRDIFCPITQRQTIHTNRKKVPWLWIGAEIRPGKFLSVTDIINSTVEVGTKVDIEFLEEATGFKDVISWKYLDAQTLKEQEFPLIGIVIEE
jgi:hypothetical protein